MARLLLHGLPSNSPKILGELKGESIACLQNRSAKETYIFHGTLKGHLIRKTTDFARHQPASQSTMTHKVDNQLFSLVCCTNYSGCWCMD